MAKYELVLGQTVQAYVIVTVEASDPVEARRVARENADNGHYTFEVDWDSASDVRTIGATLLAGE